MRISAFILLNIFVLIYLVLMIYEIVLFLKKKYKSATKLCLINTILSIPTLIFVMISYMLIDTERSLELNPLILLFLASPYILKVVPIICISYKRKIGLIPEDEVSRFMDGKNKNSLLITSFGSLFFDFLIICATVISYISFFK